MHMTTAAFPNFAMLLIQDILSNSLDELYVRLSWVSKSKFKKKIDGKLKQMMMMNYSGGREVEEYP